MREYREKNPLNMEEGFADFIKENFPSNEEQSEP